MSVIRNADCRRTETAAGAMTTLASPTLGGAERSVWRVDVTRGAPAGPLHVFDVEQIWTFLEGGATIELGDQTHIVGRGDTVVMAAAVPRRVVGDAEAGFAAVVTAGAGAKASVPGGDGSVPPWIV